MLLKLQGLVTKLQALLQKLKVSSNLPSPFKAKFSLTVRVTRKLYASVANLLVSPIQTAPSLQQYGGHQGSPQRASNILTGTSRERTSQSQTSQNNYYKEVTHFLPQPLSKPPSSGENTPRRHSRLIFSLPCRNNIPPMHPCPPRASLPFALLPKAAD